MYFLRVNVTFHIAVNMIHDVIRTANPFPYTAKFMLSVLEIIKLKNSDIKRQIELSILPTELDIFEIVIHGNTMYLFRISIYVVPFTDSLSTRDLRTRTNAEE